MGSYRDPLGLCGDDLVPAIGQCAETLHIPATAPVRQALSEAIDAQGTGALALYAQAMGQPVSEEQMAAAQAFEAGRPSEAAVLMRAANSLMRSQVSVSQPPLTYEQLGQRILTRATQGPYPLTPIAGDAASNLLVRGMNPGGFTKDVMWTDPDTRSRSWLVAARSTPVGGHQERVAGAAAAC